MLSYSSDISDNPNRSVCNWILVEIALVTFINMFLCKAWAHPWWIFWTGTVLTIHIIWARCCVFFALHVMKNSCRWTDSYCKDLGFWNTLTQSLICQYVTMFLSFIKFFLLNITLKTCNDCMPLLKLWQVQTTSKLAMLVQTIYFWFISLSYHSSKIKMWEKTGLTKRSRLVYK